MRWRGALKEGTPAWTHSGLSSGSHRSEADMGSMDVQPGQSALRAETGSQGGLACAQEREELAGMCPTGCCAWGPRGGTTLGIEDWGCLL